MWAKQIVIWQVVIITTSDFVVNGWLSKKKEAAPAKDEQVKAKPVEKKQTEEKPVEKKQEEQPIAGQAVAPKAEATPEKKEPQAQLTQVDEVETPKLNIITKCQIL